MQRGKILIIDDEPMIRLGLGEQLRLRNHTTETAEDVRSARALLQGPAPAAVLLDLQLPDGSGLDLLPDLQKAWPAVPVVMMTAHGSIESAVTAMQEGAVNYLQKPLQTNELFAVLDRAMETGQLRQRAEDRRRRKAASFSPEAIVAQSASMRELLTRVRKVASSPASSVLLLGESGTGKGLLARTIHYLSARASAPFLTVTCSAIPEPLLEAQLLGHEKGAFTDAKTRRRGVFEAADGGTVFLDEIGDMPLALQAKILSLIEERRFSRIGSTETVDVDVRIIAATHRPLDRYVADGKFRQDLYYRLRVVPLVIPPLRERLADILPLAERFIQRFNSEFGREVEGLTPDAQQALKAHAWPGNVRELRNVIEHAMLFVSGVGLERNDLMLEAGYRPRDTEPASAIQRGDASFALPPEGVDLDRVEHDLLLQAMDRAGGNKSRAAKLLGLSRDQIRYRLDKMKPPASPDA